MNATPEQIDTILDRLGSDDAYRERMLGDPVAAFAEHGVTVDPAAVPAVRSLPSKDAIGAQRAAIQSHVVAQPHLAIFIVIGQ